MTKLNLFELQSVAQGNNVSSAHPISAKLIAATVCGMTFEFYDFVTYSFFAVYIGQAYFPATNPITSLLLSVAVFGVGFVSRPLGGVLIGAYADRAGRKPAMLLTIMLITIGTVGLSITPNYASIGLAAPIIIVICRLIQGLALGGEVGPSCAFMVEYAPDNKRGLFASWQLASLGIASCFAGGIGLLLSYILTPQELQTWGWRIPFALSIILLPIAIYLRKAMPESLVESISTVQPVRIRLRDHKRTVMLAVFIVMGGTIATYVSSYMATYAIATLKFPAYAAMASTLVFGIATFIFSLLGGWLSDCYGRRIVMLVPRILTVLFAYPAFIYLTEQKTIGALLCVTACLSAFTALCGAPSFSAIPELLPKQIRASGFAIAYALSTTVFGGTTQFIITWLMNSSQNMAVPGMYAALANAVSVIAVLLLVDGRYRKLQ